MKRFQEGRRRSREPRAEGQPRRRPAGGAAREIVKTKVPADQPACLVWDNELVASPNAELGG
jgi:hypothetical protein